MQARRRKADAMRGHIPYTGTPTCKGASPVKKDKKREEYSHIDHSDEIKRLNRIIGQIEGVRKMLDEQRKLEDVLIQCKAVHSALKSIETRIIKAHLEVALDEIVKIEKKKNRAEKISELEELFKYAS
jgi:CsoR family transcriptional regulator, copper-sensing transcriptional repressor